MKNEVFQQKRLFVLLIGFCTVLAIVFIGCGDDEADQEEIEALIEQLAEGFTGPGSARNRLIDIGEPAVPALIQAMDNHENADVRGEAAFVLAGIAREDGVSESTKDKIVDALVSQLSKNIAKKRDFGNNWGPSHEITSGLSHIARNGGGLNKKVIPRIIEMLEKMIHDQDFDYNSAPKHLASALSWSSYPDSPAPEIIDTFINILNDDTASEDFQYRVLPDILIYEIGKPALPGLMELLVFGLKVETRGAAAIILGQIGDSDAVDALIVALGDEDEDVREAAVWALRKIGTPQALKAVEDFEKEN